MNMIRSLTLAAAAIVIVFFGACSTEHTDLPTGFVYDPPPTPANFQVVGGQERATLSWSYPSSTLDRIEEFRVYYYYEIYDMSELIGTTSDTSYVDSLLVGNLYYCYRISAVDTTGLEGWRTETVCDFVTSLSH
jgi:hypothetical protein